MKNIIYLTNWRRVWRQTSAAAAFSVTLLLAAQSTAYAPAFKLRVSGDPNCPQVEVTNESRDPITHIELMIGDFDKHFDMPSGRKDTYKADVSLLNGETHAVSLDIDNDPDENKVEDFRRVFFNNGEDKPNAVLTVTTFQNGKFVSASLTLPDGAADETSYEYLSESRPRSLKVTSLTEVTDASHIYINSCMVKVNQEIYKDVTQRPTKEIGAEVRIELYDGDVVEISAPQTVFHDADNQFLTDSSQDDPAVIRDHAMVRFVGLGFSVNDIPQTGDPTLYRFTVEADMDIVLKWRQDFALRMSHDFLNTESMLKDGAANAWAGPLNSEAVGNPMPEIKMHWITRGETVIAQVDGQVLDYSHPGLNIRYVPVGYRATGAAGLDHSFVVGQSPPARQQIPEFTMAASGSIQYIWQIQYGITINTDTLEHAPLPIIRKKTGGVYVTVSTGEGTFWFNPGTELQILCAQNENTSTSQGLTGWVNGDGYYFGAQGAIRTTDGTLVEASSLVNGSWVESILVPGNNSERYFRGLQIAGAGLQRPVRAMWQYGNQAVEVTVQIGEYLFQQPVTVGAKTYDGATFLTPPAVLKKIVVHGGYKEVGDTEMAVWDGVAAKLYPLVPGIFRATWPAPDAPGREVDALVTVVYPATAHYPHITFTPHVNLDPDPNDNFIFQAIKYNESQASVDSENNFQCDQPGHTVLLFSEIDNSGRNGAKEYLRVRVVRTRNWNDAAVLRSSRSAVIGQRIVDELDLAGLKTGYLIFAGARYNPFIYDALKLNGLAAGMVYDMGLLTSTSQQKKVIHPENLPGAIIPVNLHPGASDNQRIVVAWYDDPAANDGLLWPYATRVYTPRWPKNAAEGLGMIVIASQFGSESLGTNLLDQVVVAAVTNAVPDGHGGTALNIIPAETTYNPSRIQQPAVYMQSNPLSAGYNPNEEHALMAPSLRFAEVSPRPPAAYALRNNDLNRYNKSSTTEAEQPGNYTSHPYVLTQFYDTADKEFKMRVYAVKATASEIAGYRFANRALWDGVKPAVARLRGEPYVKMLAGEPVIPFYPLVEVIGAVPPPESFGVNITGQLTYWEDHKNTSWSVSGGTEAWFAASPFYPLLPDFWWEDGRPGRIVTDAAGGKITAVPNVGDSLAFLPADVNAFRSVAVGGTLLAAAQKSVNPIEILYKSDWPDVAPTLKAGETLTFAGGEYRADHPTTLILDQNNELQEVATPGLPEVLAFATAEIVFDSLNTTGDDFKWVTSWSARVGQVLEKRAVDLPAGDFPTALTPAGGRTRISSGKYVFNDLPASLQKRIRYDATNGKLEVFGLVNDKEIGDNTLTAPPPAVYLVEPNILTAEDLKALKELDTSARWQAAVTTLRERTQNPSAITGMSGSYLVGLERKIVRNAITGLPEYENPYAVPPVIKRLANQAAPLRALGPGLGVIPNADFLDPNANVPDVSWITLVENNDPALGGSPVTPHIIRIDRRERYRGSIKTVLSDNVFDENIVLRHQGDFGANADKLVFEWWYRPDDGTLNVPPPDATPPGKPNPWKIFPDLSGGQGRNRYGVMLKGNPNAPEALLADTWWYCRYRHVNDVVDGTDWGEGDNRVNFTWAGAGNSDPFNDFDLDGLMDFKPQLAMGWIKRVLDAVNPYEARIRDFEGQNPATQSSMLQQLGPRYEGAVALNPDKNVIENTGLIALYQTILNRGRALSIDLSRPVSTPAIANALQLVSTRLSDYYTLLANEAYSDAQDPTIGFGSDSVEYGHLAPSVFTFQNQLSSLMEEEQGLLRGVDDGFARPVYNRLFWNFTKGEGEAAYALNYNITDINADGFVDEDDAMILYPQGHGDAWGHYLTAIRMQYNLFNHRYFNWVSRSEFYNLMDIVLKVDFLDERKFAQIAAAKAKAGAEIVDLSYREKFVTDPTAQWQGYRDSNPDRAWGVEGWSRRAGQGAYFDWITANALLPSAHPNKTLEGIQRVDRASNGDIAVISANLNKVQSTFDQANNGYNPLGLSKDAIVFDIDPSFIEAGSGMQGEMHFDQLYGRALAALENTKLVWDNANENRNRVRAIANSEAQYRNDVFQEDLSYRNRLIEIFGKPYAGTVGSGKLYPAGYDGADLALYMYVDVRTIDNNTVPGPSQSFAKFDISGKLIDGDMYKAFTTNDYGDRATSLSAEWQALYAPTFAPDAKENTAAQARDGLYSVAYTDLGNPKVALQNFTTLMPVTTAGYSFQAPAAWGNRLATGRLQSLLNEMLQQEATVAQAIGAWDALTGNIIRTIRIVDARICSAEEISKRNKAFIRTKYLFDTILKGITLATQSVRSGKEMAKVTATGIKESIPLNLPTGGLSISPGDALGPMRGAIKLGELAFTTTFDFIEIGLNTAKLAEESAFEIAQQEINLANASAEGELSRKEWLKEIEDLVGDEPVLRIAIFKEIEALRKLSEQYRAALDEGARLVDERTAFNKRVAAATQLNRYQDMTFRVSRNHALQSYRSSFNLAARYAYLAAKAYDYETCFADSDAGSPQAAIQDIIKARSIGLLDDGGAQLGSGGLAQPLAWLKANYDSMKGQLGINNPQIEIGKISLRTEKFRIYPKDSTQGSLHGAANAGSAANELWKQRLQAMRVANLWEVPEFRQFCRPFDTMPADGVEPGIVIRFGTDIRAGKNFFGNMLSGGDHAYDSSVYAIKIRAAGVWFSDYRSESLEHDLPVAPRIYLIPAGMDLLSVSSSSDPNRVRVWSVFDQCIPAPVPSVAAELDQRDWVPIFSSLNGLYGEARRFSSFRAYHDGGDAINEDELMYTSRLVGRSVRNTQWVLIIPGRTLNADPHEGLNRFIDQVSDIKLVFETYGHSGN
ncbi:MAG: hypothetical protein PHO37_08955 [Kiritimatiellae bacterium]|nr:hypothetical protein [Kiritimatiellia bacterium]